MAKRDRRMTEEKIKKWLAEGRGSGRGKDYKPWLTIHDVPSKGARSRDKGLKTKRAHHLLSALELAYFLILEWCPLVIDIREQYPLLPLEETLYIAEQLGIRHPIDPHTRHPIVLTVDFLVTCRIGVQEIDFLRTVKYEEDLGSPRTREKLEIARVYGKNRNQILKTVTENEISQDFADNVDLIRLHQQIDDRIELDRSNLDEVSTHLKARFLSTNNPLCEVTETCDKYFNLTPSTSLTIVYHMLATRQWIVDMNTKIEAHRPLQIIG